MSVPGGGMNVPKAALAVFADDPDVQAEIKALVLATLRWQRQVMEHGNQTTKAQIARAYGPMLTKLVGENTGKDREELRGEFEAILAEMRGAPTGVIAPAPARDIPRT
jgi:hypothetical protein